MQAWEAISLAGDAVALMTTLVNFIALLDEELIFLVFGVELFLLDLDANCLELQKGSLN